jgi:outer membrane immunogenic protein
MLGDGARAWASGGDAVRKIIIASVLASAVLAASAPARAADMAVKAPPPPPIYDWSGFYAGLNLGGDWGHSSITPDPGLPFPAFANNVGGIFIITPGQFATFPSTAGNGASVLGGGQAGYNWQIGHFVYGLEGDIDGTGLRENATSILTRTTLSGTQTVTANFSANIDWIATLRGRIGYACDRGLLLYATGGLAVAGTTLNTAYGIVEPAQLPGLGPNPGTASSSRTLAGWTAGVGAEWAFDRKWSAALEYRHSDFGSGGYGIGITDASLIPFTAPGTASVHFLEDQVTVRVNYHLN